MLCVIMLFVGAFIGFFVASLCQIAKKSDER